MPCRPEEEFAQGSDDSNADLRRTLRRKRVIQPEPSDAEETESESESEADQQSEKGKARSLVNAESKTMCMSSHGTSASAPH